MTIAVLDACVLYPAAVRDALLWLASERVYSPRWTDRIHEEWICAILANRPDLTRRRLERTRALMDQVDPESLVQGYEASIGAISLPDEDDRHVVAAAIAAGASVIVTFNLCDFPRAALAPLRLRALHPDAFVVSLFQRHPEGCLEGLRKHRESLHRPSRTPKDYLESLRQAGLAELAGLLAERDEFRLGNG